jgi:hypothetical protein
MRKSVVAMILTILVAASLTVSAQQVVKDKAFEIVVPSGWTRSESVPQGLDVGFRKKLPGGEYATLYFHHEVMPPDAGVPPSDRSDMKHQWDSMLRNKYPDVRSVNEDVPKVNGTILVDGSYELTDEGTKVRRRYTYFLSDKTAFVVQCSAPPSQWTTALEDFDKILVSLKPGGSAPEKDRKTDDSAKAELKRNLPTLLRSFPPQWTCSLSDLSITSATSTAKRTLEIRLTFDRSDIGDIYAATKLLFEMMGAGKIDADLNSLPSRLRSAASNSSEFVYYVGQVWGYAGGYATVSCDPAVAWYKVSIIGPDGAKMGSVGISRDDGSTILSGKVTVSDAARVAGMYHFE